MDKDKYEIVFVNDYATALLTAAFDAVSAYENLSAKRLDAAEVMIRYPTKPSKRTCFVFCRFEGECFDHLRSAGAAIYGPQIILHYVRENQPLPRVPYPLYSTALMRAIVTVTSVTGSEREHLLSSIQMLHGQASRDLFDGVNVVITPKVGSKKYLVGSSRGLHMLLPSWISEAWKLSAIQDPIDMMLPAYTERFRVPTFSQLVICVSGLSAEERKEVSDLVVKHGGRYSGMMKVGETTHLIIKHASGLKYSHAKKWKIQIVSVNWLTDSVSRGYALDEEDYRVSEDAKENASTPVRETDRRAFSFDTNLSVISHANNMTSRIDETRVAESFVHRPSTAPNSKIERPVLADCLIQLIDCTREEQSTLSSLVKGLGGRLCTDLQDRVTETLTHVVVGSSNTTLTAASMEKDVLYVKGSWLLACQEARKRLNEADYLAVSPENNGRMEQTEQSGADTNEPTKRTMDTEDLQLINQYFGAGGLAEMDDFNRESTIRANLSKQDEGVTLNAVTQQQTSAVKVCEIADADKTVESRVGCFTGFTFWLHDEVTESDKMDLLENIRGAGGQIVDSLLGANFLVAPFFIRALPGRTSSGGTLVTTSWIDHCLTQASVCWDDLNSEKAFTPLVRSGSLPLEGCVISLSGFVGKDRSLLTRYAQSLGAIVQECFLCKAVPSRNLAASTHLVAAKLDGRKCPAAKQWGLPAVNRQWLYACADLWRLADVTAYPVGDSALSSKPTVVSAPLTTSMNQPEPVRDRRLTEIQQNAQVSSVRSIAASQLTSATNKLSTPVTKQFVDALHTPDWVQNNKLDKPGDVSGGSFRESLGQVFKPSPPLSEQVARCLKKAVLRTAALPKRKLDLSDDSVEELPLKDVVICVAKHLSSRQVELNGVAKQLGGDFKWTYDPQICTHIVAEYLMDNSAAPTPARPAADHTPNTQPNLYADVLAAKQDNKLIVHPRWLAACLTAARRLPEADFLPSTKHLHPQQTSGCEAESPPPVEPPRKITRTVSSNLLGDVNRRLELMLGCPTKLKETKAPDDVSRDPPTLNLNTISADRAHSASVDEGATVSASFLTGSNGSGPRRLRRDPRRVAVPTPGTPIVNASRGLNTDDGCIADSGTAISDRAQPGQSLMVRWQYEDAPPPRSPIDGVQGTADPMTNQRGMRSPTPTNPGQGIVGIDHLASRDSISRRETSIVVTASTESSVTTVTDTTTNDSKHVNQDGDQKKIPVVSFSGLASDERDHYAAIVSELGGEVDHQLTLSEKATHLIVHTPTRSEKCLICLASGRWMLHKSYLDACLRESRWVDETPFEWGGPGTEPLLMQLSPAVQARPGSTAGVAAAQQQKQQATQIRELARSARRWRMLGGRAFQNWRVIFGPGCDKEASFCRVIESGGGQVLSSKPPYPPPASVTHSFAKRRPHTSNVSTPLPPGYQWLRIDYLCAYLTAGQEVPRDEFLLT